MAPVARTILAQLGGNRFIAMTGAKRFVFSENSLCIHMPKMVGAPVNRLKITLTPMDDYKVEAFIVCGLSCKPAGASECYVDGLRDAVRTLINREISL